MATTEEKRDYINKINPSFFHMLGPRMRFDAIVAELVNVKYQDCDTEVLRIIGYACDTVFIDFAFYIVSNPKADESRIYAVVEDSIEKLRIKEFTDSHDFATVVKRLYETRCKQ